MIISGGMLLTLRVVLALVFGVAGIGKLADRAGARQSIREFGMPGAMAGSLATALVAAELVGAAALLTGRWSWWGATIALALLALFIAAIVANLLRGRTPDCHCFGKLHSEPVGWSTVARNLVLASLAVAVLLQGNGNTGPGLAEWVAGLTAAGALLLALTVGLGALAAFVAVITVQLLAQNGRLMRRVDALEGKAGGASSDTPASGLALNTPAPAFTAAGLDEVPVPLDALAALGAPVLLVFSDANCAACEALLPDVAMWQRAHGARLTVAIIASGSVDASRAKAAAHGLAHVLVQDQARAVSELFKVRVTPSAVLVKDGVVASATAEGPDAIRDLVFGLTLPDRVSRGGAAPSLQLRDLDGQSLDIAAAPGRTRALLFWNPTCGYCSAMLKDLQSWERVKPRTAPELVVVSAGSIDANRDQRFRSRVVIDPVFGAAKVFGASGTPSAVIIDEQGRVASDVAVGAPAVLSLLGATVQDGVAV